MNERSTPSAILRGPASATPAAEEVESTIGDPYATRRENAFKWQQGIYLLFGVIEVVLAIRFVLRLFGANVHAGFAQLVYGVTAPLVALIVYALVAWLVVKLASLAFGESRSATATTTRSTTILVFGPGSSASISRAPASAQDEGLGPRWSHPSAGCLAGTWATRASLARDKVIGG